MHVRGGGDHGQSCRKCLVSELDSDQDRVLQPDIDYRRADAYAGGKALNCSYGADG